MGVGVATASLPAVNGRLDVMNGMKRLAAVLRHNALLFEPAGTTRAEEASHGLRRHRPP